MILRQTPITRSPLSRQSAPPKKKRKGARRGRIVDRKYLEWAATQPCCISGEWPATSHHVREFGSPKNDRRIIRLAARYHLHEAGMTCIERMSKAEFQAFHGIDIENEIGKLMAAFLIEREAKK